MTALTILSSEIRQFDGLYSLNDLHAASGGNRKHQPSNFMRMDSTLELIAEIRSSDLRIIPFNIVTGRGKTQGTYVCRELVYAYAMWISPKFHLQVIRAFDALQAAAVPPGRRALPRRVIRSRDDLSFTRRDARGALVNWCVESRAGSWHEQVSVGQEWFAEVLELARHDPEEAYHALLWASCSRALLTHWNHGHEQGFLEVFAQFAVAGMLATRGDRPELPFRVREMGAGRGGA